MNVHANDVNPSHKTQFMEDGFLVVEGLLSADEIKQIQSGADNVIEHRKNPNTVAEWLKLGYLSQWGVFSEHIAMSDAGEPFQSLVEENTRAAEIASYLFDEPVEQGSGMNMQVMYGGCGCRQGWHQDHWPKSPDHRWINCMYYLNDMTDQNGSLLLIPGSHKRPLLKRMQDYGPVPGSVRVLCPAGTGVFFYMSMLHAADENYTNETRRGIKTQYNHPKYTEDCEIHEQHYSRGIRRGNGPVSNEPSKNGSYWFQEWDPEYLPNKIQSQLVAQ
ncbi:MAG: hypothetical protein COA79_04340 [Planctomycetota bacterium]|nr:MAG: hypothetical protein COA79_04340 [Planctomycetota bacterium]